MNLIDRIGPIAILIVLVMGGLILTQPTGKANPHYGGCSFSSKTSESYTDCHKKDCKKSKEGCLRNKKDCWKDKAQQQESSMKPCHRSYKDCDTKSCPKSKCMKKSQMEKPCPGMLKSDTLPKL